ncbi:hypothetical protein EAH80_11735 [Mycobacterium hodleri]|uniref:Uncharacterized protein n=2 Tax=Mycolicibacterium hodleri TaxID=49897 RepID=A0A502E988_9MYCO|nr:hypothetical protein EAH80_11735 [Mycolicibacterium hodleri]
MVGVYTALALCAFFAVQRIKTELGILTRTDVVESYYPTVVQFFYPILARFDALQANVDAVGAGPYSYLSLGEVITHLLQAMLPQQILGEKGQLAGAAWGSILRPQAGGPAQAGANLAEGPIAEGWVLAGWAGTVLEILFLAFAIILVARLFQGRTVFAVAFAVSMTVQPLLFERGMLGIAEGMGKSLQLAAIGSLVLMLLGASAHGHTLSSKMASHRKSSPKPPYKNPLRTPPNGGHQDSGIS